MTERQEHEVPLIEKGQYLTRIEGIKMPIQMKSRPYTYMIPIEFSISGQKCIGHVAAYLDAAMMIFAARHHWIGKDVYVNARVRGYAGKPLNTFSFLWSLDGDNEPQG